MKKLKFLIIFGMILTNISSVNTNAEESNNLVCHYVENDKGELEYICEDPSIVIPCQDICPPGCEKKG